MKRVRIPASVVVLARDFDNSTEYVIEKLCTLLHIDKSRCKEKTLKAPIGEENRTQFLIPLKKDQYEEALTFLEDTFRVEFFHNTGGYRGVLLSPGRNKTIINITPKYIKIMPQYKRSREDDDFILGD